MNLGMSSLILFSFPGELPSSKAFLKRIHNIDSD